MLFICVTTLHKYDRTFNVKLKLRTCNLRLSKSVVMYLILSLITNCNQISNQERQLSNLKFNVTAFTCSTLNLLPLFWFFNKS